MRKDRLDDRERIVISLIEALNFRSLRYVRQPLDAFHVLIGPNASGKTTFLDVVSFLGRLVADGVDSAISDRTEDFSDLLWNRTGSRFELALEATLPKDILNQLRTDAFQSIRYEIAIGRSFDSSTSEVGILDERAFLKPNSVPPFVQRTLFPESIEVPGTILHKTRPGWKSVISKNPGGNDNFTPEIKDVAKKRWTHSFKLGDRKTALGNVPPDLEQFPATTWLRSLLTEGVKPFVLNSALIRRPSPPKKKRGGFQPDGANLPHDIAELFQDNPKRFRDWIAHLRTALPDLKTIHTFVRPEDKHRYLKIEYDTGLEIPSWMASDGTLRMLALTLPAYLTNFQGIYLIEEPENGIHPKAVETVYQSLSSVYDAQLLLASHSPVILSCTNAAALLCFAKNMDGATDIVTGTDHPNLHEWRGHTNLGLLFAAGVLG